MQSSEYRSDVVSSPRSSDDTSESVLYSLKSVEISTGHARQHGVAIVKFRAHNRARNHVGCLSRHSRSHMTKCSDMEIVPSRDGDQCPSDSRREDLETAIIFDDVPNTADSDLSGLSARQLCSSQS